MLVSTPPSVLLLPKQSLLRLLKVVLQVSQKDLRTTRHAVNTEHPSLKSHEPTSDSDLHGTHVPEPLVLILPDVGTTWFLYFQVMKLPHSLVLDFQTDSEPTRT